MNICTIKKKLNKLIPVPLDFEIGVMDIPEAKGTELWRLRLKELITFGAGDDADEGDMALELVFIFMGGGTNTVLTWTGLET